MNTTERASHPSRAQIESLMEFLEKHPSLAKGFSKQASARDAARNSWERIALQLNSLGGCTKSWKQWTKYWADKKSAVKKKAAQRFLARNKTGGGAEILSSRVELSTIEERILALMGGESFATGDRHLAINPFVQEDEERPSMMNSQIVRLVESSQLARDVQNDEESPSLLDSQIVRLVESQPARDENQIGATSMEPKIPQRSLNVECVPGTSYMSTNPSIVQIIAENPLATTQSPSRTPSHLGSAHKSSTGICELSPNATCPRQHSPTVQTRTLIAETSSRRLKRRRLTSPPSQRRNSSSLTERFLKIEEQRVQIEHTNSQLMANFVNFVKERETANSQALRAIAESLKLLAEALKK